MASYQKVFMRYEKKYLLTNGQYVRLLPYLRGATALDAYGKSTICNIYFDTPDHRLIRASLDKPVYKEKLRLRSYGIPDTDGTVFPEIKKKVEGIVYKRRISMKLSDAEEYLYERKPAKSTSQITREIDWMLSYYEQLIPSMAISYDRIALRGTEDPELRLTFDCNILWREKELSLTKGIWGESLLKRGEWLMELKLPGAMPIWLAHALDLLSIRPCSFSKYGNAYLTSLQAGKEINAPVHTKTARIVKKGVEVCA